MCFVGVFLKIFLKILNTPSIYMESYNQKLRRFYKKS